MPIAQRSVWNRAFATKPTSFSENHVEFVDKDSKDDIILSLLCFDCF